MSNQYEQVLRLWGAQKLKEYYDEYDPHPISVVLETVQVGIDFNPGYACCGGRDPDCYCSYAESPSVNVVIHARSATGERLHYQIPGDAFDFFALMRELSDIEIKESE